MVSRGSYSRGETVAFVEVIVAFRMELDGYLDISRMF